LRRMYVIWKKEIYQKMLLKKITCIKR
jgi:hypothetical protein